MYYYNYNVMYKQNAISQMNFEIKFQQIGETKFLLAKCFDNKGHMIV